VLPVALLSSHLGDVVRNLVPGWLVPAFVVITELGNVGFLLALFVLDYWFYDHRRGAHAIGLAISGMALITALKFSFLAARPRPAVNVIPITGYSFPSGHATTAAIGYGILAYDTEIGPRWARYGVAGAIVAIVALSRVVLGVHFVRDVLAGVLFGLAFLAATIAATRHAPWPGVVLALGMGILAFFVSDLSRDGVAVFGAAIGAALAWRVLDEVPGMETTREQLLLLGGFFPVLLGLGYLGTLDLWRPFVFLINLVLMAGVIAAPHLVDRLPGERLSDREASST
jgi:membrane-associated phospholipid phosphatase